MKFLLKQKIRRKDQGNMIRVFPGNPQFIKLATSLNIDYDQIQSNHGDYFTTDYYLFKKEDYSKLLSQYRKNINEKRDEFYAQEPLIQLIKLLRYIFKRNNDAKRVKHTTYYASLNAYDDKTLFLDIALQIAKNINYSFFSYGYDEDLNNSYHHYIYYFEIQDIGQVSFHDSHKYSKVPIFLGEWIGFQNETFPFDLRKIKKLMKEHNQNIKPNEVIQENV